MWGYGYEAVLWMLVSMIIYSLVGIVVVGALLWAVIWAATRWLQGQQRVVPETGRDSDAPALASPHRRTDDDTGGSSRSSSSDSRVGCPEHSSLVPSPDVAGNAVLSRR